MTKKAAKKKQVTKKKVSKKVTSPAEESEVSGVQESTNGGSAEMGAEAPEKSDKEAGEAKIAVVQETAAEAEEPKKKMGRVPQPDGGRKRESSRSRSGGRRGGKRNNGPRPPVDQEELGKKAWEIFQHEIAEEGLALIDEISARQLAEKSLVVTRAFLEERERRLGKVRVEEPGAETAPSDEASDKEKAEEEAEKPMEGGTEDAPPVEEAPPEGEKAE